MGAIEETITVTGETPIVDVQSGTRQRVIDCELIDRLPTGRSPFAQMALIPGVSVGASNQDVGGATQLSGAVVASIHGSTQNSQLLMENGLSTAVLVAPWGSQLAFNMAASQEIVVDYSGGGAENNASGVRMNVIPREGGNTFNGVLFVNGTDGALQGDNSTSGCGTRGCGRLTRSGSSMTSIPASVVRSGRIGSGSTRRAGTPRHPAGRPRSSTTETPTTRTSGSTSRISAGRCRTIPMSTTAGCA